MSQRDQHFYRAWMTHRHVSRRGLLRGLFNGGKQAGQQAGVTPPQRSVGRPPQALEESLFLQQCDGCGACVSACPYGLISCHDRYAVLEIDFSSCDTSKCQHCTSACDRGALAAGIPADTGLRPQIDLQCLGRRSDSCRLCTFACPSGALTFDSKHQSHCDTTLCDGCGACKVACYYGHLTLSPQQHSA